MKDADPDNRLCPILMDRIYIQKEAIELLPEIIKENIQRKIKSDGIDMTPYFRGKDSLKEQIYFLLNQEYQVSWLELDNHDHVFTCSG